MEDYLKAIYKLHERDEQVPTSALAAASLAGFTQYVQKPAEFIWWYRPYQE
jgi:hypothetical protein